MEEGYCICGGGLFSGGLGGGMGRERDGGEDVRVRIDCSLVAWVLEGCCCSWAMSVQVDEGNERRWRVGTDLCWGYWFDIVRRCRFGWVI